MAFNVLEMLEAAGRVATSIASSPEGTPQRIWAELGPWVTNLTQAAAAKWLPALVAEIPCQTPRAVDGEQVLCGSASIGACDVCGTPVCLRHARVDYAGGVVCIPCVARMIRQARSEAAASGQPPPGGEARPPPQQPPNAARVQAAYRVLGVSLSSPDEVVRKAWRRLSAKHHPDRHGGSKKSEEAFKRVQDAYSVIQQARRRAAWL